MSKGDLGAVQSLLEDTPDFLYSSFSWEMTEIHPRAKKISGLHLIVVSPLASAAAFGHLELCHFLFQAISDDNGLESCKSFLNDALARATANGHTTIVQFLLSKHTYPHQIMENALMNSVMHNHVEILRLLVENGVDLSMQNDWVLRSCADFFLLTKDFTSTNEHYKNMFLEVVLHYSPKKLATLCSKDKDVQTACLFITEKEGQEDKCPIEKMILAIIEIALSRSTRNE